MAVEKEIDIGNWMPIMLGATEPELISSKRDFINPDDPKDNKLRKKGTQEYCLSMGHFDDPTVGSMRDEVEAKRQELGLKEKRDTPCPLNLIDGIDIGVYQAQQKTEDKAMVQIASNFHCLENGSPNSSADNGHLVSGYAMDCTQGPGAAFGVPGASLLRAHYVFKDDKKPPDVWGQSSSRQCSLIRDITDYCGGLVNGKALLTESDKHVTEECLDDVASKIRVGLHTDAEVVFTRGSTRGSLGVLRHPYPLVDQVCSATLCYGYADHQVRMRDHNLTRAMLRAAYEGAYLAAIKRNRKVLLLTLIGGASFRNPMAMIFEELQRAHNKWANHSLSELSEVRLLLYGKGEKEHFATYLK